MTLQRRLALLLLLCFSLRSWAAPDVLDIPEMDDADAQELDKAMSQEAIQVRDKIETMPKVSLSYKDVQNDLPFEDQSVIQKIYMPKTSRWGYYGGLGVVPNDFFYKTFALSGRFSYFFNEKWGAELFLNQFTSAETSDKRDLYNKQINASGQQLQVDQLIYMKTSYGLQAYYSSMYGKMALLNSNIVPFEIYQVLGAGVVKTSEQRDETMFNVGFGQIFSFHRSGGFRWELSAMFFNTTGAQPKNYNYFLFSLGYQGMAPRIGVRQ